MFQTLYITFDDISDDTCVLVDWGDGTVDPYSNEPGACDGVDSSRRRRSVSGTVSTAMTLSHTYMSETTFTAIVRAVHPINSETQSMSYVFWELGKGRGQSTKHRYRHSLYD